ncbi:MAG: hypothetical protein SO049_03100, partial [Prevotella sp.]|nr:hypothetical protein [Prevotella sp.]
AEPRHRDREEGISTKDKTHNPFQIGYIDIRRGGTAISLLPYLPEHKADDITLYTMRVISSAFFIYISHGISRESPRVLFSLIIESIYHTESHG